MKLRDSDPSGRIKAPRKSHRFPRTLRSNATGSGRRGLTRIRPWGWRQDRLLETQLVRGGENRRGRRQPHRLELRAPVRVANGRPNTLAHPHRPTLKRTQKVDARPHRRIDGATDSPHRISMRSHASPGAGVAGAWVRRITSGGSFGWRVAKQGIDSPLVRREAVLFWISGRPATRTPIDPQHRLAKFAPHPRTGHER